MNAKVVIPWHNQTQLERFLRAWDITEAHPLSVFQQDKDQKGCAVTKNRGIVRAIREGAEVVIVLDDDCYPHDGMSFVEFVGKHLDALEPQPVEMFKAVTKPSSRGTPYFNTTVAMPVAASMGFWSNIGDYDAPGQLVHGARHPMQFNTEPIHGKYFPLCGMNLAFRVDEFPWCKFIDIARFDDIWQGFLWQRKAYSQGKCFNLAGPLIRHSRQSNVWQNLRDESVSMERNETIWSDIYKMPLMGYDQMIADLGFIHE